MGLRPKAALGIPMPGHGGLTLGDRDECIASARLVEVVGAETIEAESGRSPEDETIRIRNRRRPFGESLSIASRRQTGRLDRTYLDGCGIRIKNAEPRSSSLSTETSPPNIRQSFRVIARPSPVPPYLASSRHRPG